MTYWFKAIGFILYLLPRTWRRFLGFLLGVLWFDILRIRRQIVLQNLQKAFPQWEEQKKIHVGRRSLQNMGFHFVDLLTLPYWQESDFNKYIVFEGMENLNRALEKQKGVYFLSLHLGDGDLGSNAIARRGSAINIITKRFKNKKWDQLWFGLRGAHGVQYIEAHSATTAFDILKALKKNQIVVFVMDQFMGPPYGIATEFFGHKTGTAYGLSLFVQKTQTSVLPVYSYEGPDHKLHVVFEKPLDNPPGIDQNKDKIWQQLQWTQLFCDRIESIVRAYPEHWMWVHRRWKKFE
ncbi:MAG: lysophospholipid acyltransferase family protein [Pseudobdellovibrionaceae bacterium]